MRPQNRTRFTALLLLCFALPLLSGCPGSKNAPPPTPPNALPNTQAGANTALFEEVAEKANVRFKLDNGFNNKFYFIESTPAGCALFDFDNDGYLDALLLQSGSSESPDKVKNRPHSALYHNRGDGTFQEVTQSSGLDKDLGYAHGVASGDYDNDGYTDLFITAYGANHLFHNENGTGKFRDVTQQMGLSKVHSAGFATSAAFGDYNNDGKLDLYVCYYSTWNWSNDKLCADAKGNSDYCSPEIYKPDTHRLYRNDGDHFTDASDEAGISKSEGRGLAVAFIDYDGDGKQDIFVANDMSPNMLWHNLGNGKFEEVAALAGCAYNADGVVMAGMGIGVADYNHTGYESLFVSDFSNKVNALFTLTQGGLFTDKSRQAGKALLATKSYLSFGTSFLDYDADGWADLVVSNGHVNYRIENMPGGITYKEPKQLFHNRGDGTFEEIVDPALKGALSALLLGRGLAVGDYDNDGRLDALAQNQNDNAQLFHNTDKSPHHWVSFKTVGTKSNRDGIHTKFTLEAGGLRQTATVRGGSSYLSASDRRVYFGLGRAESIDRVELVWSSGKRETLTHIAPNKCYIVTEGRGITGELPTKGAGRTNPTKP
ncbi:MAG: CRTAC1 family protein [Armatimonadetes bacterium]|nr:CRTAC1 family protein [Armatimonadota bacterium]